MFKNVASQKIQLFAFIPSTDLPKTGDAANITAYVSKDHGTVTVLADTSATEMDATNAKGVYVFDLAQSETNADELTFSAKSSTSDVSIVARFVTTLPTTGILAPATAGRTLVVDAAGLADANMVKAGPTGSGTAQTARDIGAAVPAATAGAAGGLMIAGSNAATTLATLTVTGATTLTGALSGTNASNDLRLGSTERGLLRDKVIERTSLRGTIGSGSTTTSVVTSAMIPATSVSNQLQGQILQFDFDTATAALRGQKTDITASSASATPTLTVTALTTAPASGDTFTIS